MVLAVVAAHPAAMTAPVDRDDHDEEHDPQPVAGQESDHDELLPRSVNRIRTGESRRAAASACPYSTAAASANDLDTAPADRTMATPFSDAMVGVTAPGAIRPGYGIPRVADYGQPGPVSSPRMRARPL